MVPYASSVLIVCFLNLDQSTRLVKLIFKSIFYLEEVAMAMRLEKAKHGFFSNKNQNHSSEKKIQTVSLSD